MTDQHGVSQLVQAHQIDDNIHAQYGPTIFCRCGWKFRHPRAKVRGRAALRHLGKLAGVNR